MRLIETTCVPAHSSAKMAPIHIGEGALNLLPSLVEQGHYDTVTILHDRAVEGAAASAQHGIANAILLPLPSGEASKSLMEVGRIAEILAHRGATRRSLLISMGGGVTTDLGGFVAANYMRGIDVINVPTSLLGMVDAAIGGKNAVNVGGVKNLMGSVHHPVAVVEDLATLQTLPDAQIPEGLAEIIKIAAMTSIELFALLERNIASILERQRDVLEECIAMAVAAKMKIVEQDPFDVGVRNYLNYGHTIGHAEEALSHWTVHHGQAVGRGMAAELAFSSLPREERQRIVALSKRAGLKTEVSDHTAEEFWSKMCNDKKAGPEGIRIAVPSAIGTGSLHMLKKETLLQQFSRIRKS